MGVSRKGKRRIVVGDREYLWYCAQDYEGPHTASTMDALTVLSPDKRFVVRGGESLAIDAIPSLRIEADLL